MTTSSDIFRKTDESAPVCQSDISVWHAPVESVRQSRSLWPITNECVNCLLLATLVGMRSPLGWAAGVHIHTHTHTHTCASLALLLLLLPTNQPFGSVSSLILFLFSRSLFVVCVLARGKIGSIGASFLDNHNDKDTHCVTVWLVICSLLLEKTIIQMFTLIRRVSGFTVVLLLCNIKRRINNFSKLTEETIFLNYSHDTKSK